MPKTWKIEEEAAGERLDVFLTSELSQMTRSAIQKAIKQGHVLVNDTPTSVHNFLRVGDQVVWADPIKSKTSKAAPKTLPPLTIVAETDDWVVIDKPIGVLVHADDVSDEPTMVDALVAAYPSMVKVGEDPRRPGIMHRLDRDVSGLMVVAKTQMAFEELKRQFASRKVTKNYLALVHGIPSHEEGDIKLKIARSTSKARMAARPQNDEGGQAAWTHYRTVETYQGASLLELQILSGRTHQIRAHLFAIGHPVVGDKLYKLRRTERHIESPRLMLQSVALTFLDPKTQEPKSFTLAPDPAFAMVKAELNHE